MTELKFALSIEEAADYTGIGRNTLRNLVEWEKLPILRVGRKILIRRERLDEFLILNEGRSRYFIPMSSTDLSKMRKKSCLHSSVGMSILPLRKSVRTIQRQIRLHSIIRSYRTGIVLWITLWYRGWSERKS